MGQAARRWHHRRCVNRWSAPMPQPNDLSRSLVALDQDSTIIAEALSHYNGAVEQLKSGNWAGFGAELDALRPLLEELSQHSTGRSPLRRATLEGGKRHT